ncbi:hypothetical protein CIK67_17775 [Brachybacterium alimentarium]|nr:hypothetical protein CIK67_17775 [Brachybacterium alimentarium]
MICDVIVTETGWQGRHTEVFQGLDRLSEPISGYAADKRGLHGGARGKHDELFDHSRKDFDRWVFLSWFVVVDDRSDVES